jgi:hypothetical protein
MSIQQQIDDQLKAAMRARDSQTLGVLRMLKSKMTETTTTKGFKGEVNDALWLKVIASYAKQQRKALEMYRAAGEQGASHIPGLEFEIKACEAFLPTKADAATMQGWVDEALAGLGGKENAKFGSLMGAVMKTHRNEVDPGVLRGLINAALS